MSSDNAVNIEAPNVEEVYWDESYCEGKEVITIATDYIVFIDDKTVKLDWGVAPNFQIRKKQPGSAFDLVQSNDIQNRAQLLEASPVEGLKPDSRRSFLRLLGMAVGCSFDFDYANARGMLDAASRFYQARCEEVSRFWYLSASAVAASIFMAFALLEWMARSVVTDYLGSDFLWLSIAACLGAIGALLSVIWRSGQLKFDCAAGKALHYLEATSRIAAGSISGLLVALAIKGRFLLGGYPGSDDLTGLMMLGALVGGSGERLATSIITKFEVTAVTRTEDQKK